MTTIVKAADAAQFLSLVPRMLGYRPSRSLVLIPFEGSRSTGALRLDLPTATDPDELDRIAATFVGMVCRIPRADAFAAIVYTDAGFAEGMPHAALVRALEERADECGIHVTDVLCVGPDAWGSYLDPDLPGGGHPFGALGFAPDDVTHLDIAAGDQAAGAELPAVDPAELEQVDHALASLDAAVRLVCGADATTEHAVRTKDAEDEASGAARVDPRALEAVCTLDDLPALFENALEWDASSLAPFDAAAMVWCLARPALRDIALVAWCGGIAAGDEALDAQLKWEGGAEYPTHLAMRMWGEGERPDPERLAAALELTRRVAAVAPKERRAGPLATAAWLSWALGRSTHADVYAGQACEVEPEHGLAEIVRSFVHAGHLPDWAFR